MTAVRAPVITTPWRPWDHAYEAGDDMVCVTCGWIGSYAHTEEFYRKYVPSAVRSAVEVEATTGFEPVNRGFAAPSKTGVRTPGNAQ